MKSFFAIVGVGALLWLALRWCNLVWFRAKTLGVITRDLHYNPSVPGLQAPAFKAVTRAARASRWNEYDAAIAFMLVQLGVLSRPFDNKSWHFYAEKLDLLENIVSKSTVGDVLIKDFTTAQRSSEPELDE